MNTHTMATKMVNALERANTGSDTADMAYVLGYLREDLMAYLGKPINPSRHERAVIRAALDARAEALENAADPNNPFQREDAVGERATIAVLLRAILSEDEREDESLLTQLSSNEE